MNNTRTEELRDQVFSICQKLTSLRPPIDLKSKKADETLRYWLPEISWNEIELFKKEYISQSESASDKED